MTGASVQKDRARIAMHKQSGASGLLKTSGVNIAFSKQGLDKLGLNTGDGDKLNDAVFDAGMLSDAQSLGDKGTTGQDASLLRNIDGLILVTRDCRSIVTDAIKDVKDLFGGAQQSSITEAFSIVGDVRPGTEDGHGHFGFEDGISQPAMAGVEIAPQPGQVQIPGGIVLLGREGDNDDSKNLIARPSWAVDGSFLCFRKLAQLVPEFDEFLTQNALL
ncbi:hypothetical protein B9Z65_431 [Elsinoe australis]|uniref:DyP dimeric alpha+beta barrel domain-containing protein n=1 Tax=Elsinoe australis TaxID=40998 RepID=A0A2P8AIK9_9PEZI|nr:hypothetical protein B9Z65_431 [Elsinoe australis]